MKLIRAAKLAPIAIASNRNSRCAHDSPGGARQLCDMQVRALVLRVGLGQAARYAPRARDTPNSAMNPNTRATPASRGSSRR